MAPENTLRAFQKAINLELERTELDVRLTKDRKVVVIHDDTVDRTTNGNGKVEEMTLNQLKRLRCPMQQQIPTLRQVIKLCKNRIDFQIELKGKGTPPGVNRLIQKYRIEKNVLITSFDIELLKEMRKINPYIKIGLLFEKIPDQLWCIATQLPLNYICPKAEIVTEELVKIAHALQVKVYAYHTNNIELGFKMINLSVDDIGTDFPNLFLSNI